LAFLKDNSYSRLTNNIHAEVEREQMMVRTQLQGGMEHPPPASACAEPVDASKQ
jgi:hypothetical protein